MEPECPKIINVCLSVSVTTFLPEQLRITEKTLLTADWLSSSSSDIYSWLWRLSCHNKRKVFFWLLLNDRLSTRELLKQRNMVLIDYNCILCNLGTEESLVHMFLACPFVMAYWSTLGHTIHQHSDSFVTLASLKDQLQLSFSWKS